MVVAIAITIISLLSVFVSFVHTVPVTIDTSFTYRLTNNYTGLAKSFAILSDGSGTVEMANTTTSTLQYWKFAFLR